MRRYINSKSILLLVPALTFVAMLLRIWTRGVGPDENGLYPHRPLAWVLLWLLTAATAAAIIFAVRRVKNNGTYRDYYPRSMIAGLCSMPAAICFLVSGYLQLRDSMDYDLPGTTIVDTLTAILGLVAGLSLLLSAIHRCVGKKPFFLANGLVCLYFAFRLFNRCQIWSNEPQIGVVVFPFFASLFLMLSTYQRVCFDVDLGKRPMGAFWHLMSVYFCAVALLSLEQPLFYAMCAVWQMADVCSLRPIKRKITAEPEITLPEAEA